MKKRGGGKDGSKGCCKYQGTHTGILVRIIYPFAISGVCVSGAVYVVDVPGAPVSDSDPFDDDDSEPPVPLVGLQHQTINTNTREVVSDRQSVDKQ